MSYMVYKKTDIASLKKGDYKLFTKTLSDTDAMLFAGISGEMSPLYLNESFSHGTEMKTRTVHPMLVASIAGGAILRLLQPATKSVSREFRFLLPVFAGDTVTAIAEVEDTDIDGNTVSVKVSCYNQTQQKVLEGQCVEQLVNGEGENCK